MIAPLLVQSRQRVAFSGEVWLEPYLIGFMAMLIAYIATRRVASIDSDTLALIQAEVWHEITDHDESVLAEELIRLSLGQDQMFEAGCRNGASFGQALCAHKSFHSGLDGGEADDVVTVLWQDVFDQYVKNNFSVSSSAQ
jgi:hypothetical protein